ncbi:glucose-1-phosphate thymidylyltransferase [Streptomyces sp. NPDC055775]
MKALVLSGGSGTRLRPITHTSAAQLVLVANKPVLFYGLDAIADAGITDVGIVVGETAEQIRHAVGDGSRFGLDITYIPQEAPLGLAHAVLVSREFLGDEDFVMYLGDNIVIDGITGLVQAFRAERTEARILLTRMPDPTAFGVAELDGSGAVIRLEEKPACPRSDLALVGVYLFSPAVHEAVRSIAPSRHGELEITHAIQWLIDHGRDVRATTISGYWKDTGDVSDMLEANRSVLEGLRPCIAGEVDMASEIVGRVTIADGARVRGSRIVGPAIIGSDAIVSGSSIGPFTSIAEGCRIEDTEIEFSIVLPGASIEGVHKVEASVIGRGAEVTPAPSLRRAHRLVLGDHSKVQISSSPPPRSW